MYHCVASFRHVRLFLESGFFVLWAELSLFKCLQFRYMSDFLIWIDQKIRTCTASVIWKIAGAGCSLDARNSPFCGDKAWNSKMNTWTRKQIKWYIKRVPKDSPCHHHWKHCNWKTIVEDKMPQTVAGDYAEVRWDNFEENNVIMICYSSPYHIM